MAVVQPRRFDYAAAVQYHDNFRVDSRHSLQQIHLILRKAQIAAVKTLTLGDFIQTHAQNNCIRLCRQFAGGFLQSSIRLTVAVKALLIPDDVQLGVDQLIQQHIHLCRVHHARACALIARIFGKVADDSHLATRRQRQQRALVFQQHKAFRGGAAGKRMMGCRIKLTWGSVQRSLGIKHQRQQL